jgi:hypothetical protein
MRSVFAQGDEARECFVAEMPEYTAVTGESCQALLLRVHRMWTASEGQECKNIADQYFHPS